MFLDRRGMLLCRYKTLSCIFLSRLTFLWFWDTVTVNCLPSKPMYTFSLYLFWLSGWRRDTLSQTQPWLKEVYKVVVKYYYIHIGFMSVHTHQWVPLNPMLCHELYFQVRTTGTSKALAATLVGAAPRLGPKETAPSGSLAQSTYWYGLKQYIDTNFLVIYWKSC